MELYDGRGAPPSSRICCSGRLVCSRDGVGFSWEGQRVSATLCSGGNENNNTEHCAAETTVGGVVKQVDGCCQVTLQENVLGRLRCASVGGYPPPELTMFIGDRDVTPQFRQSTAATLHGEPGLRLMVHQTVLWTDRLAVTAADDGETARCVATVSGLGANTTYIRITVICESVADCNCVQRQRLLP